MKFYFQIQTNKPWASTKAMPQEFNSTKEAIEFAKRLSSCFNTEVRMTDNAKLHGGEYFNYKGYKQ